MKSERGRVERASEVPRRELPIQVTHSFGGPCLT